MPPGKGRDPGDAAADATAVGFSGHSISSCEKGLDRAFEQGFEGWRFYGQVQLGESLV